MGRFIGVLFEGWGPPPCHVVVVARGGELVSVLVTSAVGSR